MTARILTFPPQCLVSLSSNLSVADSTWVKIGWTAGGGHELTDPYGPHTDAWLGTPPAYDITPRTGGKYAFSAQVQWNTLGTGSAIMQVYSDGPTTHGGGTLIAESTGPGMSGVQTTLSCSGRYDSPNPDLGYLGLSVWVWQNSGGGGQVNGGAGGKTFLQMHWFSQS